LQPKPAKFFIIAFATPAFVLSRYLNFWKKAQRPSWPTHRVQAIFWSLLKSILSSRGLLGKGEEEWYERTD
jgi:hypothetical protein